LPHLPKPLRTVSPIKIKLARRFVRKYGAPCAGAASKVPVFVQMSAIDAVDGSSTGT
jgi:hypothetical protein